MGYFEDVKAELPANATVSHQLLDSLIERTGGTDRATISPSLFAALIAGSIVNLEQRIIDLEERFQPPQ